MPSPVHCAGSKQTVLHTLATSWILQLRLHLCLGKPQSSTLLARTPRPEPCSSRSQDWRQLSTGARRSQHEAGVSHLTAPRNAKLQLELKHFNTHPLPHTLPWKKIPTKLLAGAAWWHWRVKLPLTDLTPGSSARIQLPAPGKVTRWCGLFTLQ